VTSIFELPLTVDGYEIERLTSGYERQTNLVRLRGAGREGLGEDVSPFGDQPSAPPSDLALAGEWTLGAFCDHVSRLDQWTEPPEWEDMMRRLRNWAFESAALDLALRQAGRSLPEVLGREPKPVRFVNSLGLGDPPAIEALHKRLDSYPELRFKLDADARWTPELIDAVAASGAVDIVDFKGRYGLEVADEDQLLRMYEYVLPRFPDALFEDPHEAAEALMEPYAQRISHDAPIHAVEDITTPTINIKASRIGSLRRLFAIYEHCERNGIRMYSGGMGELGCGRGQAQLLTAMFHPDAPNDIAPSPYNEPELRTGLPVSPLTPDSPVGFRW
jgi:L-alanine-DL-glutamate epimerase-like enolase superfamily enzyme